MDLNSLKQQLLDLQMRLNSIVSTVVNGSMPTTPTPTPGGNYPATEAPPAYDKCRPMWEQAQREGLFRVFDYVGQGLVQGSLPDSQPRMSQEMQDKLEAAIQAIGRSEWGQRWLSSDYNASMIDRRYCYSFVGYWVSRVSNNPDDGFKRHYNAP